MTFERKLDDIREKITSVLIEKGVVIEHNDLPLSELVDRLLALNIMDVNGDYNYGVRLDDIGFITQGIKIDKSFSTRFQEIPDDLHKGYYYINKKGQLVLDEERKRLIE